MRKNAMGEREWKEFVFLFSPDLFGWFIIKKKLLYYL
jgi:hypothetical protein